MIKLIYILISFLSISFSQEDSSRIEQSIYNNVIKPYKEKHNDTNH